MKRDNLWYLIGGLAFGFLFGYGVFYAVANRPEARMAALGGTGAGVPSPSGPMAPTQVGGGGASGGAGPMVAEINELKRVLQADPENLRALVRLANLHHDASMWSQATGYYEKAIALEPNDPNLLTDLGVCYQALERFEDAMGVFARAQAADPSHWQSLYNMVVVAGFGLNRMDEAEDALEKLEKIQPSLPQVPSLRHALEQLRAQRAGAPS